MIWDEKLLPVRPGGDGRLTDFPTSHPISLAGAGSYVVVHRDQDSPSGFLLPLVPMRVVGRTIKDG